MSEELLVDMGQYIVSRDPVILVCLGLGSCIGAAIFDADRKIGAMAHVMLPSNHENLDREGINLNKYATVAIPKMVDELVKMGCGNIKAKIAGGANMFQGLKDSDILNIGQKNAEMVKKLLTEMSIPLLSSETGGSIGRTVRFEPQTGKMTIKSRDGIREI